MPNSITRWSARAGANRLDRTRKTLVFYRDCPATRVGGAWLCGAVTIEPFEVSRWRGRCGGLLWDLNEAGSAVASRCGRFGAGAVAFGRGCGWERGIPYGAWGHECGWKLANGTRWGAGCESTHEADGRDGVRGGHWAQVLGAGSGAVERMRGLPDGDQRVAQILSRDAFKHDHGTGAEGT
jgi:hypothetical protein